MGNAVLLENGSPFTLCEGNGTIDGPVDRCSREDVLTLSTGEVVLHLVLRIERIGPDDVCLLDGTVEEQLVCQHIGPLHRILEFNVNYIVDDDDFLHATRQQERQTGNWGVVDTSLQAASQ